MYRGLVEGRSWPKNEFDEIGCMEKSRRQNEDGVRWMKVEDAVGDIRRDRIISKRMGKSLGSLDVTGGTSAEGAGRPRDTECLRTQRRGRRDA
jgi:hypothetical protein